MTAHEAIVSWAKAQGFSPETFAAFAALLTAVESEAFRKGESHGYHMRGQVDWELR